MKNKIIEFFSFILIVLTLVLLFISSIRITNHTFTLLEYSYYLIFIGVIGLIIYIVSKVKNFKFNKYEIIVLILMILSCLSLINAINIKEALWGRMNRNEGLFVILTYYILILIGMKIKNKKYLNIILSIIIFIGFSNFIYGIKDTNIIKQTNETYLYARGFVGQHMYYGSIMAICYPIILGIYLKTKKYIIRIISYILMIIFTLALIISGTMSVYLSIILIFLLTFLESSKYLIKKEYKKFIFKSSLLSLCLIIFSITLLFVMQREVGIKNDVLELFQQTSEISQGEVKEEFGTGRIYIWKNTILKIKENPFGVGIDNFYNAFDPPLRDANNKYIAKAHNDYLQKMLCEGIIPGTLFVIFLLMIFFQNIFKSKSEIHYALFLAFTSYSIQAFFNISVIRVAPIYFIIIGLLLSKTIDKRNKIT